MAHGLDLESGPLICETDEFASIDRAVAQYLAWLDYDVIPVVDIAAGSAWARSAAGIG